MAENTVSYGIGLSDQQLNAMLNSDIPEIRQRAENYVSEAQSQQQKKSGILQKIGNFFVSPAASAEITPSTYNLGTGFQQVLKPDGTLEIVPVQNQNQFPFVSMSEFAKTNNLLSPASVTPKDTLTSLKNFQDNYYLDNKMAPPKSLGFDTTYGVANEPDVPQVALPGQNKGIPFVTQAKDFITQTVPKAIKTGIATAIDFIPGMRFVKSLDKFDTLPYQDRKFIESVMDTKGLPGSGVYVDPSTGLVKDMRGKNVRSLMGNYAEDIEESYQDKLESLEKSKDRWEDKYGDLNNTNNLGKTWSEMNNFNLKEFNFLEEMKNKKDKQTADLKEKIKNTKSINIHDDPYDKNKTKTKNKTEFTDFPNRNRPDKSGATGTKAGGFTNPGKGSYGPHR